MTPNRLRHSASYSTTRLNIKILPSADMVYQASGQTINTVGAAVSRADAYTYMMYLYTYCGYVFRMRK
jgi:hypothetical protein